MVQILFLRVNPAHDGGKPKMYETGFEKGIRAVSVDDIFLDPDATLVNIPNEERYNVFYTVAECTEEKGRKFLRQHHIPFDIDGIEVPERVETNPTILRPLCELICQALGVEFDDVAILFSGNGLQILIGMDEPFEDVEYFDRARIHYKALCDKIDLKLSEHGQKGKADPSIWSSARLLRHPKTFNRKPDKPLRQAVVVQPNILRGKWRLEGASGIPDVPPHEQVNTQVAKSVYTPDASEIMDTEKGCKFLAWAKANPNDVSEPQWYAGVSIVGRFPNGREAVHEFSQGYKGYSYVETDMKFKHALEHGPRTCEGINRLWGNCSTCPHYQKITTPLGIVGPSHIKTVNTGFREVIVNKDGQPRRGKPAYMDLVKFFERQHEFVSPQGSMGVHTWNGKSWDAQPKDYITGFIQRHLQPEPTNAIRAEFYGHIRHTNAVRPTYFDERKPGLFNFGNGVYDIADGTLKPHEPSYGFLYVLPCDFDADAKCPRFDQFMREVTLDRVDLQMLLQEFMGYCLSGMEPIFHQALLLVGVGANGKSTFGEVMRSLCGKGQFSSVSVRDLSDPVYRFNTVGKLANISEENSRNSFRETDFLKDFIGGGTMTVREYYSQPIEVKNNSKLIMMCNELPDNNDQTTGFYRRLQIVPFDAKFSEDHNSADTKLIDKLRAEMPGIFNYAMEGYRRLMEQNGFTKSETVKTLKEEYSLESDIVKMWLLDEIEYTPNNGAASVSKNVLYNKFTEYCAMTGHQKPPAQAVFGKRLKIVMNLLGWRFEEFRAGNDSNRTRELKYLRIKERSMHMVMNMATKDVKGIEVYE